MRGFAARFAADGAGPGEEQPRAAGPGCGWSGREAAGKPRCCGVALVAGQGSGAGAVLQARRLFTAASVGARCSRVSRAWRCCEPWPYGAGLGHSSGAGVRPSSPALPPCPSSTVLGRGKPAVLHCGAICPDSPFLCAVGSQSSSVRAALGAAAGTGSSCSPTTRCTVGLCFPHVKPNKRGAVAQPALRVRISAEDSSCGCEVRGGSRGGVGDVSALQRRSEHGCLPLQVLSEQTHLRGWVWVVRLHSRPHRLPGEHPGTWLGCGGGAQWGADPWGWGSVPTAVTRVESRCVSCRSSTRTVTRCWGRTTRASAATAPPTRSV